MRLLLSAVGAAVLALVPAGAHRIRPLGHASPGGGYTGDVFVHRGFAYLSSWHGASVYPAIPLAESRGHPPSPGFRIFDATDPRHPTEIGSWIAPDSLRGGKGGVFVHSVRVNPAATRAYLSYWNLGTVILDISKPAHPQYLGRTKDPQGSAHSTALTPNGKVMIETHETNGGRPSFWSISNPRRPRLLTVFKPPARLVNAPAPRGAAGYTLGRHDPKILGKRAYFSWYGLGVIVADISNP